MRKFTQPHVVLLGAGHKLQQRAKALGRLNPQLDIQPAGDFDAGFVLTLPGDALHLGVVDKCFHDRLGIARRRHEIQVTNGDLTAAQAAGDFHALCPGQAAQPGRPAFRNGQRRPQ